MAQIEDELAAAYFTLRMLTEQTRVWAEALSTGTRPTDEVTRVVWKGETMIPKRTVRLEPGDVHCHSYSSRLVSFFANDRREWTIYDNRLIARL